MKVIHCNASERNGGAARAAWRLHVAQRAAGIDSHMLVMQRESESEYVHKLRIPRFRRAAHHFRQRAANWLLHRQNTPNDIYHSHALVGGVLPSNVRRLEPDIVNLHWLGDGFMGVMDMGRLPRPIVWTLHDMWAFCGAEHCDDLEHPGRYIGGYTSRNRHPSATGLDVDRLVWRLKMSFWKDAPTAIVTPSRWLSDCVEKSRLFRGRRVETIPNTLKTDLFRPMDQLTARMQYGLPRDRPVVASGAAYTDSRAKGMHLLAEVWARLRITYRHRPQRQRPCLMIFGVDSLPEYQALSGDDVRFVGRLDSDEMLIALYNSADVMVVPSMLEAFGQTASEPQSCGTPVVAFDATGLRDVVVGRETGLLASPFDTVEMARHVETLLDNTDLRKKMGQEARKQAVGRYSPEVVARAYRGLYEDLLA